MKNKSTRQVTTMKTALPVKASASQNTATGAGARKMGHGTASIGAAPMTKGAYPISSSSPKNPQRLRG